MRARILGLVLVAVGGGEALAAEHVVTMAGGRYQPATLSAKVGDTVRFVNDDTADHAVFVPTIGKAFDLGRQKAGEQKVYKLGQPGRLEVECVNHGRMQMVVEVSP